MPDSFVLRDEYDRQRLIALVGDLKLSWEKPLVVSVEPLANGPSAKQRRRHWAIMHQISEHAEIEGRRFAPELWHKFFCGEFIGQEELPDGSMSPLSSESLERRDYVSFDERICAYAVNELGIELDMTDTSTSGSLK
jgi:hypothetical protein